MEQEPKFVQIISGWAAVADRWAVFGDTKEEALNKFREAERKHEEISKRLPSQNESLGTTITLDATYKA